MKYFLITILTIFVFYSTGYSQIVRYNQAVLDTNLILFTDTVNNFVTDSFEHDIGFVPQINAQLTKYYKYIGNEKIYIKKSWTGDPHYICSYPGGGETLIPGKIYSFDVCFSHILRPGLFQKRMGFRMSNDSIVTFVFKGTVISENKNDYEYFGEFYRGYAPAKYLNNWILVDNTFKKIIDFPYDCLTEMTYPDKIIQVVSFSEDLMPIKNCNNKIGFIDRLGNIVIPCLYTSVDKFSEGLCFVSESQNLKNCFVINNKGQTVIEGTFEALISNFNNGRAIVSTNGNIVEIDTNGAIIRYLNDYPYSDE